MNRLLLTALWVVMTSAHADEVPVLDKDFQTMMAWFPGVYDNQEQVYFEAEQEVDEALRHERIHHVFEPVDLPAFGEHVFYVQQHLNDDPAQIYRQRIYASRPDYKEGAIRLTIYIPNTAKRGNPLDQRPRSGRGGQSGVWSPGRCATQEPQSAAL